MTKRDLAAKAEQVKKCLALAKKYSKLTLAQLLANEERRLAVERVLFLLTQSAIDLAESYCHARNFQRPASMHEAISILEENEVISADLSGRLLRMVGFRNVLTHGYSKIDYSKVVAVLKDGLSDIEKLLKAVR